MRPYEERWEVKGGGIKFPEGRDRRLDDERVKLAAQAPAMARKLVELLHFEPLRHEFDCFGATEEIEQILRDGGVIP